MEGFFIFECMAEFESVVAIVQCDLSRLKKIIDEVSSIHDKFDGLADISFWDAIDAYESFNVDSFIKDKRALHHYEEYRWAFVSDDLGEPPSENLRARVDRLHVDKNSVWWSFTPKHGNEVIETPSIEAGEIVELIGNLGNS